jgi:hypothetical protein
MPQFPSFKSNADLKLLCFFALQISNYASISLQMSDLKPSASSPVLTSPGSPRTPKKLGDSGGKSDKQKPPVSPRGLAGSGGVNITYSSPAGSQPSSPSSSLKRSASFRLPDENSQSWRTISMPGNKSERRRSIIKTGDTKKVIALD